MDIELLENSVNELFNQFGAGDSHPGSGSAAALQGMLSAKMISTVITITANSKFPHLYAHCINELLYFQEEIEKRIYPALADLFQKDSDQFKLTIETRRKRDAETDVVQKNSLRRQALADLKVCIAIPFKIADLCIELANMSSFVFENGVGKARGDSQVGLSGAVSALAGCISIIRLNVLSYTSDEYNYTKSVIDEVENLNATFQKLNELAIEKIKVLDEEFKSRIPLFEGITVLLDKYRGASKPNLEQCVRDLQNLIWKNRHLIWKKNIPETELDILRPKIIFEKALGYDCVFDEQFGVPDNGVVIEVAGVIDQPSKFVGVSTIFRKEIQNFTVAHELGHAILHDQSILHRDTPTDRTRRFNSGDFTEYEADKFAAFFLMPRKLVKLEFQKIFKSQTFIMNDDSAFQFGGKSVNDIRKECKNLRGLTRKLASTEFFGQNNYTSLATLFGVSVEAMAIRLEELNLVGRF
jgi:Zn-dependent peptidase ImmA (M78 family)/formiminotetrahydrofolate cyclodeaminase